MFHCTTACCSEIGSLPSSDAPELHASSDVRKLISLHQAVYVRFILCCASQFGWIVGKRNPSLQSPLTRKKKSIRKVAQKRQNVSLRLRLHYKNVLGYRFNPNHFCVFAPDLERLHLNDLRILLLTPKCENYFGAEVLVRIVFAFWSPPWAFRSKRERTFSNVFLLPRIGQNVLTF